MAIRQKCPEKRKSLLNATLSLVNNNGFHDAPMSKIAKLANVSPATIYIYFENKQDLINQLYLEIKTSFSEFAFLGYDHTTSVEEGFKIIWNNIANFKINQVEESTFLSQCDNNPIIDKESREKGLLHLQPLLDLWECGQKEGVIKPISPYLLYAYTIYPLAFLMTMKQRKSCDFKELNLEEAFQAAWDSIKI